MLRNFDKPGFYQKVCRFFNAKDIEKSFIEFDRRLSGFVQDLQGLLQQSIHGQVRRQENRRRTCKCVCVYAYVCVCVCVCVQTGDTLFSWLYH